MPLKLLQGSAMYPASHEPAFWRYLPFNLSTNMMIKVKILKILGIEEI
jgi:hypothetical protein